MIPGGVTYVPGTLELLTGPGAPASPADAAGDDVAELDAANNGILFRLGSGADATQGGLIAAAGTAGDSASFSLDVTVNEDNANGAEIVDRAHATFFGQTLGIPLTADTTAVTTTVAAPDLTIAKVRTPAPWSAERPRSSRCSYRTRARRPRTARRSPRATRSLRRRSRQAHRHLGAGLELHRRRDRRRLHPGGRPPGRGHLSANSAERASRPRASRADREHRLGRRRRGQRPHEQQLDRHRSRRRRGRPSADEERRARDGAQRRAAHLHARRPKRRSVGGDRRRHRRPARPGLQRPVRRLDPGDLRHDGVLRNRHARAGRRGYRHDHRHGGGNRPVPRQHRDRHQ